MSFSVSVMTLEGFLSFQSLSSFPSQIFFFYDSFFLRIQILSFTIQAGNVNPRFVFRNDFLFSSVFNSRYCYVAITGMCFESGGHLSFTVNFTAIFLF